MKPRGSVVDRVGQSAFQALILVLVTSGTPAWSAESLVTVESLTDETAPLERTGDRSVDREIAFEEPVVDGAVSGFEQEYQLQILQQEVLDLRGLLEEVRHTLESLKRTHDQRYLELDGRFQAMREEMSARPASQPLLPYGTGPETGTVPATPVEAGDAALQPTGVTEQSLYETALELIRNRQYDVAITQLEAVISQYPDGPFAPNAYYWLGEVFAAKPKPDYERARQALSQVLASFPNHRKTADAAFKLGKVYHLMGDCARAVDLLNKVVQEQQGKSVSRLAANYLRDKVDCAGAPGA